MNFIELSTKIKHQFTEMCKLGKLFRVNVEGKTVWNTYFNSFKEHPIWRVASEHACDNDEAFMKRYGNVVAIKDGQIITMFDFDAEGEYKEPVENVKNLLKAAIIESFFVETFAELKELGSNEVRQALKVNQEEYLLGVEKTNKIYTKAEYCQYMRFTPEQELVIQKMIKDEKSESEILDYKFENGKTKIKFGKVNVYNHFHVFLPKQFVDFTGKSVGAILGVINTDRDMYAKTMRFPLDTLEAVRDLINEDKIVRADGELEKLLQVIEHKKRFETLKGDKDLWLWLNVPHISIARFSQCLLGTLCVELAEGKDITEAAEAYNFRNDTTNKYKGKKIVSEKQKKEAEKELVDSGYITETFNSFERRFANKDDINIAEIKYSKKDDADAKPASIFEKAGVPKTQFSRHKRAEFDGIDVITIDKFMEDILPNITSMEVLLENKHEANLCSLFTTINTNCKKLFKWDNHFNKTYNGNLSGKSMIKENVKAVGGKTSGAFRCSLQWNDADTKGIVDLDLHCETPATEVYYGYKKDPSTTTWLDIDMINPEKIGIENITIDQLVKDGVYKFFVYNYSRHTNHKGFKAEIEFGGETFNYEHLKSFTGNVNIATITVTKGLISIVHHLPESSSSKPLWGLNIGEFHKVNLVCLSPSHWGDNKVGTKDYLFMLQGCKTDKATKAFHIEDLSTDLLEHRKALQLLGDYKLVTPADKQLSGLGFNATNRDEIIVKLEGSFRRTVKIVF